MRLPLRPLVLLCLGWTPLLAQAKPRARDLGIPFGGTPGKLDAITDVTGVEVGHRTLISGDGKLVVGKGPVRTGVTAILPRGRTSPDPVFAAWFTLNGNGEMTGTSWVEESGQLWGPVMITNTLSIGAVRTGVIQWAIRQKFDDFNFSLPVIAETWDGSVSDDGGLNDIDGFHITPEDAIRALDDARGGAVAEGNVGGGTGMECHEFKGGIGTASRVLSRDDGGYTIGVLVQCNYGLRRRLSVAGVPVGKEIRGLMPCHVGSLEVKAPWAEYVPVCGAKETGAAAAPRQDRGSIIIVIATDAPLLPHQLKRVAKRASLGVGRMGGFGATSSGDIFIAFSAANPGIGAESGTIPVTMLADDAIDAVFEATVQATEEAILNAMLAAETMTGADGYRLYALPVDSLKAAMKKYGR
jgi:L-aminopeptidase/D-esterase-like protein